MPWVGRVELHFHPFNGTMKPWGYHHGISVYCFLNSSCSTGTVTGSQFLAATENMSVPERESQILAQLLQGNMPSFLTNTDAWVPITVTNFETEASPVVVPSSSNHSVEFRVLPDYN
eukprot:INCI13443.7.p2 GENE.INCI13443.7~~INCI13443.7.p2  ORF type:complete len:117 (+),score=16.62 INCI13443.7:73-423(+)